eukprot:2197804-Ditylum_brightwellii.AAC.2
MQQTMHKGKRMNFRHNWLSDTSTYPIIIVLSAAGCLCAGFGSYFLLNSPDVQISPMKRNSKLRTWE